MRCVVAVDRVAFAVESARLRSSSTVSGAPLPRRARLADAGEHAHDILRLTARMPRAEQIVARIGERARDENALRAVSGSRFASFLSSTMDLRAISRAAARCAADTRTRFSRSSGT